MGMFRLVYIVDSLKAGRDGEERPQGTQGSIDYGD